jgi:TetR/AcrR family transcriptional regulator, regulator of biofilm formation and stress response
MPADQRRAALIEAALVVMARDGLAAGTTRAIVAEAGMPLASFHYCFHTRDELLRELIQMVVTRELEASLGAMAAGEELDGKSGRAQLTAILRAALSGYLEHIAANPGHELVLFELNHHALRTPELSDLAVEQYRQYYAAAEQVLAQAGELAGVHWRVELPVLARLVVTVLDGATTTWLADRDTDATRAALNILTEQIVALASPPRARRSQ